MESQINEIDPVTVEVAVQVPWDRVRESLNAGYGKLQKSVRVRGFRPGKVPRNVLVQLYGPQVKNEVIATLVEEGLVRAVRTHELAVVATPQVGSLPTIKKGEPLSFTAKIEVRPTVDELTIDGIEVSRPSSAVSDEEVEAEIERLRKHQADIVTPEKERPSKEGDLLTIDYVVEIDGEPRKDMGATGRTVELGGGRLLPEFDEGLIGKSVGDKLDIRVAYGEDVSTPDLVNKRALFKVEITELREKILPDLDDEFAKDIGEHETLEELRAATREHLETAAERRAESSVREQVIEQLVGKNEIPVPPSLVKQQEDAMRKELALLQQMVAGLDLGSDEDLRERAEQKVRAGILMGELARREDLSVPPEEIDAKLQEIAEETGKHIAKVRVEYAGEKREALANRMLEDKLLDFLVARATVTDATSVEEGQDR